MAAPDVSTPARDSGSTSDAPEAPGAPSRNRTYAKMLKELESFKHTVTNTISENEKLKTELKEQKSATRRPRSVRVAKKRPAGEIEVGA